MTWFDRDLSESDLVRSHGDDEIAALDPRSGRGARSSTSRRESSALVEIVVEDNAHVTHTSIQNGSPNVANLVTKGGRVETGGHMEWIESNIGSKHRHAPVVTMLPMEYAVEWSRLIELQMEGAVG